MKFKVTTVIATITLVLGTTTPVDAQTLTGGLTGYLETVATTEELKITSGVTSRLSDILEDCKEEKIVISSNEVETVASEYEEPEYISYDVPSHNGFKSYMDAKWITRKGSDQYRLKLYYELADNGIYMVDGRYCVAVGSYYTTVIGTKIDLEMINGSIVPCILADCKADKDTDKLNRQNPNGSVVEFVVASKYLHKKAKQMGDCSYADERLSGEIKSIRVYMEE